MKCADKKIEISVGIGVNVMNVFLGGDSNPTFPETMEYFM